MSAAPARDRHPSCRLRHRQDPGSVDYATDSVYRCRWRRRQDPLSVGYASDRWRSMSVASATATFAPGGAGGNPASDEIPAWPPTSTHRPHRHHAQQAGRIQTSSWGVWTAGNPHAHTVTCKTGRPGPQCHTITAPDPDRLGGIARRRPTTTTRPGEPHVMLIGLWVTRRVGRALPCDPVPAARDSVP